MSDVLEVRRDDLGATRVVSGDVPTPGPGEVVLRVRRFALSANNITYGLLGDLVGYWQVFPSGAPGWGRLPMWGFAEVVASAHAEVAEGRQVFGYVPMASHLVLTPARVNDHGLTDAAEHRRGLAPAYNAYRWLDTDPLYDEAHEDELLVFLPVFMLPFLLDAFLAEHDLFGASTVVVTSASSKASLGIARLLAARNVDVTAVTSSGNASFVEEVGAYARTVTYDRVADLPRPPAVLVDVAGNAVVRRSIHEHLGDRLAYSALVGSTHQHSPTEPPADLPGPAPTWFFAPDHLRKRVGDWGRAEFDQRFGTALVGFAGWTRRWLTISASTGASAVRSTYLNVLRGGSDPATSHVLAI